MLNQNRKKHLETYADSYTSEFRTEEGITDLIAIAKSEDVIVIYDHYDKNFEGLTICEEQTFFIHIDLDSISSKDSGRARFTLAHELGHALIDKHRFGLLSQIIEPHVSEYLLGTENKEIELEADFFASCLLMPYTDFRETSIKYSEQFSIHNIIYLSEHFKTSFLATVLRFVDVGPESIFVTFNKNNRVKWYSKSADFPSWPFKFRVDEIAPKNTVVGDYARNQLEKYESVEQVDPESWFYVKTEEFDHLSLNEQCYYMDDYMIIVSILWFS